MQDIMQTIGTVLILLVTTVLCIIIGKATKNLLFVIATAFVGVIGGAVVWALVATSPLLSIGVLVLVVCGFGFIIKTSGVLTMLGATVQKHGRKMMVALYVAGGLFVAYLVVGGVVYIIVPNIVSVSEKNEFEADFPAALADADYAHAFKMADEMFVQADSFFDRSTYAILRSLAANASDGLVREFEDGNDKWRMYAFENTLGKGLSMLSTDSSMYDTPMYGDWSAETLSGMGDVAQFDFYSGKDGLGAGLAAVRTDGTVFVNGGLAESDIRAMDGWRDIKQALFISSGVVGLTNDGAVVSQGNTPKVSGWSGVVQLLRVQLPSGHNHLLGLKDDGMVYYSDPIERVVSQWTDIEKLYAEDAIIFGTKRDGSVCVYDDGSYTDKLSAEALAEIENWRGITQFSVYNVPDEPRVVFGLTDDGTIVSSMGDAPDWTDVAAIATARVSRNAAGDTGRFFVGLKENGEIVYWEF